MSAEAAKRRRTDGTQSAGMLFGDVTDMSDVKGQTCLKAFSKALRPFTELSTPSDACNAERVRRLKICHSI